MKKPAPYQIAEVITLKMVFRTANPLRERPTAESNWSRKTHRLRGSLLLSSAISYHIILYSIHPHPKSLVIAPEKRIEQRLFAGRRLWLREFLAQLQQAHQHRQVATGCLFAFDRLQHLRGSALQQSNDTFLQHSNPAIKTLSSILFVYG